ncbi:hypothetical protein [Phyllobacterium leguminum]|uniref:Uncharacterized protein n=1 Tax=Phyllobacterium leguminum TaxID=314237 RepID=A0A318T8I4_9HYPH|nr:hypothetical protein [Phyllobacterium leguminum]PYE89621.1 hypothetical protein C7477_103129 [Phyllobacterium leguminum]
MAKAVNKTEAPAGEGHNSGAVGISEKDRKVLFFINRKDWIEAMEAKKAADAKVKQVGKAIKADLGKYGLDQIKAYEKAQTPEGIPELKARRDADLQAMRFAGVPVNTQLDIFIDRAPAAERAYGEGEEAGLRGDTLTNPYNEASPEGQEYARGWHEGQGALFAGIKQKQDDADTRDDLIQSVPFGEDPDFPDGEDD